MSRNCFNCFTPKSNVEFEAKKYTNKKIEQNKDYKLSEKGLNSKQNIKNYPSVSKSIDNVNMNGKKYQNKYSIENSEKNNEASLITDNLKYMKRGKSNIGFSNDEFSSSADIKNLKIPHGNSQLYLNDYDEDMLNEILVSLN